MKAGLLTLAALLLAISANAQANVDSPAVSRLLIHAGAFVVVKPLNPIIFKDHWLIPDDTVSHADDRYGYRAFKDTGIDVKSLSELIVSSRSVDTTLWTTQELAGIVLVAKRESYLNLKEILATLKVSDEDELKGYRKSIRRFNNTNPDDRYLYSLSRPIFDNAGRYAAVLEVFGASGMSGGGVLAIFEKKADGWYRVGTPKRWAY